MLNNRGQSLILFVMVLPILLLILILVVDVGKAVTLKQELDGVNKMVLNYGLDIIDSDNLEQELSDIINLNSDNINDIRIELIDSKLYIKLISSFEGIFSSLIDIELFDVNSYYVGYIDDGDKRIERVSGD